LSWAKFDDKRALNKKLRAAGLEARGLDDAAICHAAGDESDGFISDVDVQLIGAAHGCSRTLKLAAKLVAVGRWTRDEERVGYWIHDYLEFNPSHADLVERREIERSRKERGRNGQGRSDNGRVTGSDGVVRADVTSRPRGQPVGRGPDVTSRPAGSPSGRGPDVTSRPAGPGSKVDFLEPSPSFTGLNPSARGDADNGDSCENNGTTPKAAGQQLARLVDTCTARDRGRVGIEAIEVLMWAREHASEQLIDEAIGYCAQAAKRPVFPSAVAKVIALRAADAGIVVAPFAPAVKTAKAGSD